MKLRRIPKNKPTEVTDVVADLKARTQQAQSLASVPRQELLADPRLNPSTRALADRLEADRLRARLDWEHRRYLRSEREADRRAEDAIRAAEAVDRARAATDPAYTVLTLVRSRGRFAALSLGASLVLSVGSAMGLEAAVTAHYPTAPTGIGYLGEVALTGMSTAAIIWAGLLARSQAFPTGGRRAALIGLIVVPLLVSIVGSTIGSGPVGAVASLGSAAFSWFAYLIAVTSADAIGQLVKRMGTATTATEIPVDNEDQEYEEPTTPLPHRTAGEALEVVGEELAEQVDDYLRSHGSPSERSHGQTRSHGTGPERSHGDASPADDGADAESAQVTPSERTSERDRSHDDGESPERVLTAQERRRLEGLQNRRRVANYLYRRPDAHTAEIATELGLGESTVRRIRKELENGGEP
ncbi:MULTISPECIES: winged helix-turn-helix domain-containing protein [Nocardiopsis]|uniref:winged helix-turn-helix domain-containing protein n=1 Tax=Nocardiopsis TaxID=2013 RepID=UPI000988DFB3|nr:MULTISPECIES: winged helix-turn-helix domain-containing protein [Nocardiopsis]